MGLKFSYISGQTPIDEEEKEGLKIKTILYQSQLNEFEQKNIEDALLWIKGKNFAVEKVLTETFVKDIHKRMYKDVWRWAGLFRKTEKNIGVPFHKIGIELKYLLDDTRFWIENKVFEPDEIAMRFKHRLVSIHCFPNGNGRHSRVMADIVIQKLFDRPVFSWGAYNLSENSEIRSAYISTLKMADQGNYEDLLSFCRS